MRHLAWTRSSAVSQRAAPPPTSWPLAHALLLACLCLLGIALRVSCVSRPFWIDEAWVLNSVQATSLAAMFDYREWLQTTPPGLLLVLRALVQSLPQSLEHLRWLFVLCGVGTLLLFVRLALKLLGREFLCLACATFALSPAIVWNATEIKQYGFDALAMVSSLACGLAYIERPSRALLARWCGVNLLFVTLSFSAVFCLPAMVVVGALMGTAPRWPSRVRAVLPHTVLAALFVAVLYLTFVHPHAGMSALAKFWAQGFFASSGESPLFYLRRNLSLLFNFLDIETASPAGLLLLLTLCGLGAGSFLRGAGQAREAWARSAMLALPVIATLAANLLGVYPLGEYRMVAFLAPCLILLLVRGVACIVHGVFLGSGAVTRQRGVDVLAIAASLAMAVYLANTLGVPWWGASRDGGARLWRGNTEILPALNYLREVDDLRRPLFVHAFYHQLYSYHMRDQPLRAPVSFASSGYPCCIPDRPWHGYGADRDDVAREVDSLITQHGRAPFHALLYARPGWPSRDSAAPYVAAFTARGCAIGWRYDSYRVALLRVECAVSE
jgi:hypothetical protein